MRTRDDALAQFDQPPVTPATSPRTAAVRDVFLTFVDELWDRMGECPERTIVLRKLQEAQMYAYLAALELQPTPPTLVDPPPGFVELAMMAGEPIDDPAARARTADRIAATQALERRMFGPDVHADVDPVPAHRAEECGKITGGLYCTRAHKHLGDHDGPPHPAGDVEPAPPHPAEVG